MLQRFRNLRIGIRLALCFSLILTLMSAGTWLSVSSMRESRGALLRLVEQANARTAALNAMRQSIQRQDRLAQRIGLATEIEAAERDMSEIDAAISDYRRAFAQFDGLISSEEERRLANTLVGYDRSLSGVVESAHHSVQVFNPGMAARTWFGRVAPVHADWLVLVDELSARQARSITTDVELLGQRAARIDTLIQSVAAVAILLAALGAWRLTAGITRPLRQAVAFAAAIGRGDLDTRAPAAAKDEPGLLLAALGDMASRLQLADAAMRRLAMEDGLTGAFNRRHLDSVLTARCQRVGGTAREHVEVAVEADAGPFSLLLIDVDHFKQFNDRWGHQAGDACLCAVVDAIRATLRWPSDLVARYGGEEFAVILPGSSAEDGRRVAERVRCRIADVRLPQADGDVARVTASIGVTNSDAPQAPAPAELLRAADAALYEAKHRGRNQIRYRPASSAGAPMPGGDERNSPEWTQVGGAPPILSPCLDSSTS